MNCNICGSDVNKNGAQYVFGTFYNCDSCGKYIVESNVRTKFDENWVRNALYYYIRQLSKRNAPVLFSNASPDEEMYKVVSLDDLDAIYPKNIHERIDWILLNLYQENSNLGKQFSVVNNRKWAAIFAIKDELDEAQDQYNGIIEILTEMNYLKRIGEHDLITIAYDGWKRIDHLQSNKRKSKKVFIAMWFNQEMKEERKIIKKAIRDSGFIPIIIDEKEHNNQIVPEILYEINTCEFLVADLTGGRNGVYYEAGYGLGKGKNVILTLKEGTNDVPHFDVSQTNQIRYNSPRELYDSLMKRIEATIKN